MDPAVDAEDGAEAVESMLEEPSGSNRTTYAGVFGRDRDRRVVFLGGHHTNAPGVVERVLERLIGEDVEFLLLLALHVDGAHGAEDVDQAGPPGGGGDDLGSQRNVIEQVGEFPGRLRVLLLLVDDEPFDGRDRGVPHHGSLAGWVTEPRRARTVNESPSVKIETVPSRSVRQISTPAAASRPSASGEGCPYRFSPTLMTAVIGWRLAEPDSPVAPRAVVSDLQHLDGAHPIPEGCFDRQPSVAPEERLEPAVLHQQHDGVLIQVRAPPGPQRVRMEHPEPHSIQVKSGSPARRHPRGLQLRHLRKKRRVERVIGQRGRVQHLRGREAIEHGRDARGDRRA
jgi:hypothetical protein